MSSQLESGNVRKAVLVRAGLSLWQDGPLVRTAHEQLMMRSSDSEVVDGIGYSGGS